MSCFVESSVFEFDMFVNCRCIVLTKFNFLLMIGLSFCGLLNLVILSESNYIYVKQLRICFCKNLSNSNADRVCMSCLLRQVFEIDMSVDGQMQCVNYSQLFY